MIQHDPARMDAAQCEAETARLLAALQRTGKERIVGKRRRAMVARLYAVRHRAVELCRAEVAA